MNLGEQVEKERTRVGMTQAQLAYHADISTDTLSRIEKNRNSNPSLKIIQKISKVLNIKFEL